MTATPPKHPEAKHPEAKRPEAKRSGGKLYHVKDSPLHGKGLFAAKLIKKDTVIGELVYRDATWREVQAQDMYVLWKQDDEPVYVTCDLRYINHSSKPNAAYFDDATVAALCDIKPGEEITHDYSGEGLAMEWGE